MTIALIVGLLSVVAVLQFFVSFCRSLVTSYRRVDLSAEVQEAAEIKGGVVNGDEFERLLQLISLSPDTNGDRGGLRAVRVYFAALSVVRVIVHRLVPAATAWIENERASCAHYAAVVLEQHIAYWRDQITRKDALLA
jgi:hypothetical protein